MEYMDNMGCTVLHVTPTEPLVALCYRTCFLFRTSHSVAGVNALRFLRKVVFVSITAAVGEAVALPIQGVIVPASVTGPTWTGAGGLCAPSWGS